METECSLLTLRVPATCPYPEPDKSSPWLHPTLWRSILILSSHLHLGLPIGLFPSGFPTKILYTPLFSSIHATCPIHLILHFITRTIFGEEYRSLSFPLSSFLHSPVTSSLWGTNIPLNTLFSYKTCFPQCQRPSLTPIQKTGRIILLNILIFSNFWIANWKTKDSARNGSKHSLTSICS